MEKRRDLETPLVCYFSLHSSIIRINRIHRECANGCHTFFSERIPKFQWQRAIRQNGFALKDVRVLHHGPRHAAALAEAAEAADAHTLANARWCYDRFVQRRRCRRCER